MSYGLERFGQTKETLETMYGNLNDKEIMLVKLAYIMGQQHQVEKSLEVMKREA